MSNELSTALSSLVKETSNTFGTAIGDRFFPHGDVKEETATKPYATYLLVAQVQDDTFDAEIDNVLIRIKNVSDSNSKGEVETNNKLARDLLNNTKLTVANHVGVQLIREGQIPAMRSENKLDWISTIDFRTKMQKE